ncbi:MAG: hypothetical protein L0Z55_07740, partial [Planctomycetes bacterium]|nr:hypothetical protein [Planctomycetota bacterium]
MSEPVPAPRGFFRELRYIPQTLGLAWGAAPRWTLLWILLLLAQGLLPLSIVWLSRELVDELVAAIRAHSAAGGGLGGGGGAAFAFEPFGPLALAAILLGAALLAAELLRSALEYVQAAQAELVHDHVSGLVHAQTVRV